MVILSLVRFVVLIYIRFMCIVYIHIHTYTLYCSITRKLYVYDVTCITGDQINIHDNNVKKSRKL